MANVRLTDPCDTLLAAPASPLTGTRFGGLMILLVAEGVLLAVRYHWTVVDEERLQAIRLLVEPALPAALATAIFSTSLRRGQSRKTPEPQRSSLPRWPFLLAHLLAFVSFARAVAYLVAGDLATSPYPDAWVVARLFGDPWSLPLRTYWIGGTMLLGVVVLFLWEATVFPLPHRRRQWGSWQGWEPLLGGITIGGAIIATGWITRGAWKGLGGITLWTVHHMLGLIFRDVVYRVPDGVVGTPAFTVWIAPACSGYEGIGLVLIFLGTYLWLDRRNLRFPRALLLLPIGAAVMWFANAIRITALVAVGVWVSPKVAGQGFHVQAGWLALNVVALGLVGVAQWTRFAQARPEKVGDSPATAAYLVPLLALVATGMITRALSDGFDSLYPLRVLVAVAALVYFRRAYVGLRWSWSWPAFALGCLVFLLWVAVEPSGGGTGGGTPEALAGLSRAWAVAWLIGRVVGSGLVVPLAEELAFRGYLVRRLIGADFEAVSPSRLTWSSLLISSALFGALHGHWLAGTAAGAAYALAQRQRGQLGDAVLAHATTNGLLAAYALATGNWSSWS
ncbi:exosortase E/protease, VPEID-CTERM system [Singulisphaera sp. GP187]|uniref:exosortase E/protease, VPEID-CTERM system n=1 Tax=Singulisphaera sp. GP187 TaxID=1882752 RepID=UPI0009414221|nr:exosortase E/protease, VPEID-CTERM system [Singulisphaera sp. GP187]